MDQGTLDKLAHQFMVNAVGVQPGQNIWIEHLGPGGLSIAQACAEKVKAMGAKPYVFDRGSDYMNGYLPGKTDKQLKARGRYELAKMKTMHGYIRVGDDAEQARVTAPHEDRARYQKFVMRPMTQRRVEHTNWLVTRALRRSSLRLVARIFRHLKSSGWMRIWPITVKWRRQPSRSKP